MVIQDGRLSPASFRSLWLVTVIEDDEDSDGSLIASDLDASPIDDSDSEQSEPEPRPEKPFWKGTFLPAPTLEQVEDAVQQDLQNILKPPQTNVSQPYNLGSIH